MFTTPELAHMRRGIAHMEAHDGLWEYTHLVTNLGIPTPFRAAPAAVYVTANAYYRSANAMFRLGIDAKACDGFRDPEMAGVLLHEAHHIIFKHLSQSLDTFPGKDRKRLTIAQEIQVNDQVLHLGAKLPDNLYFGVDYIGKSSVGMSTLEIYELLPTAPEGKGCPCAIGHGGSDMYGSGMPQGAAEAIENEYSGAVNEAEHGGDRDPNGVSAGAGDDANSANAIRYAKENDISPEWASLLASVSPEFATELRRNTVRITRDWGRAAHHLAAYRHNGAVLVPRAKAGEGNGPKCKAPAVRVAIFVDQSGSIGAKEQVAAATLAASAPTDKFAIDLFVFAGSVAKMPKTPGQTRGIGYGTSWGPVVRQANLENYDAVLVLTDGEMNGDQKPKAKNVYFVDIMENKATPFAHRGNLPTYPVVKMSDFQKRLAAL